ncbi:hypothetical protein BGZ49_005558, partial [Haplosporangium sp. Z 27]
MYEDPISQLSSHYNSHHHLHIHGGQQQNQRLYLDQESSDQELQRLHQHQTLIQLRLEVNALRTQIQQLELLKQQLIHQKQFMQPAEYDQLMDQFSRTTASLLRVANPCHFSKGGNHHEQNIERISGGGGNGGGGGGGNGGGGGGGGNSGGGGTGGGEAYVGMHMMERLQEKLRSMTIQQHEQQQQHAERQRRPSQDTDADMETEHSGAMSPRRDP